MTCISHVSSCIKHFDGSPWLSSHVSKMQDPKQPGSHLHIHTPGGFPLKWSRFHACAHTVPSTWSALPLRHPSLSFIQGTLVLGQTGSDYRSGKVQRQHLLLSSYKEHSLDWYDVELYDDYYKVSFSKGTLLMVNQWFILHYDSLIHQRKTACKKHPALHLFTALSPHAHPPTRKPVLGDLRT